MSLLPYLTGFGLTMAGANLDKASCTRWVGETYLEAMAPTPGSAIGRSEFLNAWKDYLPEPWRNEAVLSKLTVSGYPSSFVPLLASAD